MLIYLHGFRSGPQSQKAVQLGAHMAARGLGQEFWCKQLSHEPQQAIAQAEAAIAASKHPPLLVGSSLGGFYATVLAERHDLHAILVNPFVPFPGFDATDFIGTHDNLYSGERFDFTLAHAHQILALHMSAAVSAEPLAGCENPAPLPCSTRLWLLAEEADEVLDTRIAVARYAEARQTILPGGDHGFTRWADYLDEIVSLHLSLRGDLRNGPPSTLDARTSGKPR